MDKIWANRLTATPPTKTWEDVPASRKSGVLAELASRVEKGTLSPERYEEITGEGYES